MLSTEAYSQGSFFRLPLTIQDSTGRSDSVQFGIDNLATKCIDSALGEEEIPSDVCCNWFNILCIYFTTPFPYDSTGDCLGNGVRLDLRDFRSEYQVDTFWVNFCGTPPWVLRWPSHLAGWVDSAVIQDHFDGFFYQANMLETDSIVISNPVITRLSIILANPNFLSDVSWTGIDVPVNSSLFQNYPNPFNSTTTIKFVLTSRSQVHLRVFDILGRQVAELINGLAEPGSNTIRFEPGDLGSGVYIYRLSVNGTTESRKLIIQK
jgi:hypothetical protein